MKTVKCLINGKELLCEYLGNDNDCYGINVKVNNAILFVNYNEVLNKTTDILIGQVSSLYKTIKELEKTEENYLTYNYLVGFGGWVSRNPLKAKQQYFKSKWVEWIDTYNRFSKEVLTD